MSSKKKEKQRYRMITIKKTIFDDGKDKNENKIIINRKMIRIFIIKDKVSFQRRKKKQ